MDHPVAFNNYPSHQTQLSDQPEIWVSLQAHGTRSQPGGWEEKGKKHHVIYSFLFKGGKYLTKLILSLYEFLHRCCS